ncbi:YeaC family protein [Teredinibacter purpureus]|uniref:YeaC family protein n=1 Tax=Teredinibacter purpureus TaxID=2731756 RepID=UPI0005F79C81|nr:DUF1315 family protein [Teredinibacter purpureus]
MTPEDILRTMTPEIYRRFQTAIEIRKWPDGKVLSPEQTEICLQAIIAYEHKYVPENERTGFVPPKKTPCSDDTGKKSEETLKWQ